MTGTTLTLFTQFHVLISLIAISTGFLVAYKLATARHTSPRWTGVFLWTTVATSVTGFLFPVHKLMPSHVIGIISLVAFAPAIVAYYRFHMEGGWRHAYIVSAMIGLYLNFFVLIAQSFDKIPALKALAPTQSEPPFLVAQLAALVFFIGVTVVSLKKSRQILEFKEANPRHASKHVA